jgi:hypothetical protein
MSPLKPHGRMRNTLAELLLSSGAVTAGAQPIAEPLAHNGHSYCLLAAPVRHVRRVRRMRLSIQQL